VFERIKEKVKEGRWEITANTWVEGSRNLASGEAIARQILYTKQYFKEKFGLDYDDIVIDWEPDTFGHAWTVPQILSKAGIKNYYFCRCGKGPVLFWWQGPDGSRVLASNKKWYNGDINPGQALEVFENEKNTKMKDYMIVYGVGDHGGGPTREHLNMGKEMQTWPIFPNVKFSTTKEIFKIAENYGDNLPVINDELNFIFRGCYTSQSEIKRANRYGENLMGRAETFATIANVMSDYAYPRESIFNGWRNVLFNQFHDILPGSGVRDTREYSMGLFQETDAHATLITKQALKAIANHINTTGNGTPLVVFNDQLFERTEPVTFRLYDWRQDVDKLRLLDCNGNDVPVQIYAKGNYWGHYFLDCVFTAQVPALGYMTYYVSPSKDEEVDATQVNADHLGNMENEFFKLKVELMSGSIISLYDKVNKIELIPQGGKLGLLKMFHEVPHGMTSWRIGQIDRIEELTSGARTELIESGPSRAVMRTTHKWGRSSFSIDICLYHNVPLIDFKLHIDWHEKGDPATGMSMLKVSFPLSVESPKARFDIPYGSIGRPVNGDEVPAQKWASVEGMVGGKEYAVTLVNDCKYGHSVMDGTIDLTLIRSSYDPDPIPEQGTHEVRYALVPAANTLLQQCFKAGYAYNSPLVPVLTDNHKGELPGEMSFAELRSDTTLTACVKKAEKGSGVIVRFFEVTGAETTAVVRIYQNVLRVVETDLLEREVTSDNVRVSGDTVEVRLAPYEIKTVLIEL
jgi:alpha-mannosidase